jgi:hypothetical protein
MKITPIASNMTELTLSNGIRVLFSYSTPVACELNSGFYKTNKKWSNTTTRHVNKWLDGKPATEATQGLFDDVVNGSFIQ